MNKPTLHARAWLTCGALMATTALVAITGVWRPGMPQAATRQLAPAGTPGDALTRQWMARQWMADIRLNALRLSLALKSSDPAATAALARDIAASTAAGAEIEKRLNALSRDEQGGRLMAEIAANRARYLDLRAALWARKQAGEDVADAADREMGLVVTAWLASLDRVAAQARAQAAATQPLTVRPDATTTP